MDLDDVLHHTPAVPPPPGVTPNFVDPETRAPVVIVFSAISVGLLWPVLSMRLYTKAWIVRSVGWDDGIALFAAVITTVLVGLIISYMAILGPHGWDIPISTFTERYMRISFSVAVLVPPVFYFAKLSIFLLYLRLFSLDQLLRYLIYGGIGLSSAFYGASTIYITAQCIPRPSETWLRELLVPRCSRAFNVEYYLISIYGILLNLFIWGLPLPVIWRLHMPMRRKIGVMAIFATGLIAIFASILGFYYRVHIATSKDEFWSLPPASVLTEIEAILEIICGSMPTLPSFFRHCKERLSLPPVSRFWKRTTHASSSKTGKEKGYVDIHFSARILEPARGDDDFLRLPEIAV